MIYHQFKECKLSALGFGAMRLPILDSYQNINKDLASKMINHAFEQGVNYFDTAWGYHDGSSEEVLGDILSCYPRDNFYLATKFPGYDLSNMTKVEEIFNAQLKKCKVAYFDFYLFHNVCEMNIDAYLNDEKYGIYSYLIKQKKLGKIKHLGFSAHGSLAVMKRFLEKYGKDMEFCQIQLNYLDYLFQNAKEKIELLNSYNIPVWVMEPIRGGKLANIDEKYQEKLKTLRPNETNVSWAFRFLQSLPSVTMVLSGMSDFEQVKQNIETFNESLPLNEEEMNALLDIANDMISKDTLPCTACRYCTSHCPKHLDIPELISLYNEHRFTGGGFIAPMALGAIPQDKWPSACIGCKSCEKVCPQQIKISEMMRDFTNRLS